MKPSTLLTLPNLEIGAGRTEQGMGKGMEEFSMSIIQIIETKLAECEQARTHGWNDTAAAQVEVLQDLLDAIEHLAEQ